MGLGKTLSMILLLITYFLYWAGAINVPPKFIGARTTSEQDYSKRRIPIEKYRCPTHPNHHENKNVWDSNHFLSSRL